MRRLPIFESQERVRAEPEFTSRFRWRAVRRMRQLDAGRLVPFYRYEVVPEGRRWAVVAFQNVARPPDPFEHVPPEHA